MLQNTSQGHKAQAHPTCYPGTKYNSTNYKSTISYDQNTISGLQPPPPLLTRPTQHIIATHIAPSPTHYHTPPIRLPFHCTLISHHSMLSLIQPAHPQPLLNSFILLKHLHSHHKHIILFSPHRHPTSIPHPTPQYPGWVPANDTKGHACE